MPSWLMSVEKYEILTAIVSNSKFGTDIQNIWLSRAISNGSK